MSEHRYSVTWSEEDQEYVGLCASFPSLSYLAPAPEDALRGIRRLVQDIQLEAKGKTAMSGVCAVGLDDLWIMTLSTIRYSMGRRTYMSSVSKEFVRRYGMYLTDAQRAQIANEIDHELELADRLGYTLGDPCDEKEWRTLVDELRK